MYSEIHQLKAIGLNKAQVARRLAIDVKTVTRYWEVAPDQFHVMQQAGRNGSSKLKKYQDVIVKWLEAHPDMSAAQVLDWLKEHYGDFSVRERTLRRYINELRKKHNLPKPVETRQFQAVPELPPGKQMQLDFGQKKVRNTDGGYNTLYCMGAVLAHSRYKYGQWSEKPLNTAMFVKMLLACFEYCGGIADELVIDQDTLLAVSENYGDIIYTYEFEKFKQAMGFNVYLCRKGDPESKGKIEAVVKYFKGNFASNRLFADINSWNQSFYDWLDRTGNRNVHGTTKKVPAEVFLMEQKYLKPVPWINVPDEILTRTVRKDNTILYRGNRYSVPLGTYRPHYQLKLEEAGEKIRLIDQDTGNLVAEHTVSLEAGKLIQNNNHLRNHSVKVEKLFENTLNMLGNTTQVRAMLEGIRREKPRYVRDQFILLKKLPSLYSEEVVLKTLDYCLTRKLFSATDCHDVAAWFDSRQYETEPAVTTEAGVPKYLKVKAEKRDIASAYGHLTGGEIR